MPKKTQKSPWGAGAKFVREQPLDMPVADLVARAADAGIKLASSTVYQVRQNMRYRQEQAGKGLLGRAKPNGGKYTPDEVALMRLAIGIGIPRAAHLLDVAHQATLSAVDRLGEQ